MKKFLTASCVSALFLASSAAAADLTQEAQLLKAKALTDSTAWDVLESLTTEIGPRSVGTPGIVRAKDWGLAKLTALGFENVHAEPFTAEAWVRGTESAEVISPFPQKLAILGLGGSAPTPPGGLEAEIVLFKSLQDLQAQPPGALKGKIAVITQAMRRTQGPDGYGAGVVPRSIGAAEAAKRGAVAFLVRSISTDDTRLPHTGAMRAAPGIPAAALSVPDAQLLERMATKGRPVRLRLTMTSTVIAEAQSWNVVGEIKGEIHPDEVIVVGGHLDSWDPGTGAIDDASGIAIATAAAHLAGTTGGRPARTLRVVMWGSEEQGGSGEAYALAHRDEAPKIILAGESDLGGDEIWRARLPKGAWTLPAMQAFATILPELKVVLSREPANEGGSDVEGLKAAGAPVVDFDQDASRYFDLHHSADDTLDKVDPKKLAQNVAVWAAFLRVTANSDVDLRKSAVAP